MPSIVIPAHDEERSIARLLGDLAALKGEAEIIVACNGCTDRTVATAREAAPWATVIELVQASKPAALNAGDAAAVSFPRLYLDADVQIDADSVRALFTAVDGRTLAAAATPHYDMRASSRAVRSHQQVWQRLPANNHGIGGTNAMVVSQQGRARFRDWPALIGDDYFLDGLFGPDEKRRVPAARVIRPGSRGLLDSISRKARIDQGNRDVVLAGLRRPHTGGGMLGLVAEVRSDPRLVPHLPAHLAVTLGARGLSWWRRRRGTSGAWFRDRSRD